MERINSYKNLIVISILLLLFFIFYSVTSSKFDKLEGQYSVLKKQYEAETAKVEVKYQSYLLKVDSIKKEVYLRDLENQRLKTVNKNLQDKIDGIVNRPINPPKDLQGLVNYYNTLYKTDENKVVGDKVGLGLYTARDVSYDLEEGSKLAEIIPLKDAQIKNLDSTVTNLNSSKKALTYSLDLSQDQIKEYKELQELASDNIKNLEKQNRTLKTKNALNKILIPVSVAAGVFIGTKLK